MDRHHQRRQELAELPEDWSPDRSKNPGDEANGRVKFSSVPSFRMKCIEVIKSRVAAIKKALRKKRNSLT